MKSTKYLILKTAPSGNLDNEDFDRGLLELRNTPNMTGCSPAQILYGRPLRSCVPAHSEAFSQEWQEKVEDCDRRAAARAEKVKQRYDQHAKSLPKLRVGQTVRSRIRHHTDGTRSGLSWAAAEDETTRCDSLVAERIGEIEGFSDQCPFLVLVPSPKSLWPLARTRKRSPL